MELEKLKELIGSPAELVKSIDSIEVITAKDPQKFYPEKHDVMDEQIREKRKVGNTYKEVHRIPSDTQKEILDWSVDLALSGGVGIDCSPREGVSTDVDMQAMIKKTLEDNKFDYIAEEIERIRQIYLQVLLVWYTVVADEFYWQDIPSAKGVKKKWRCMVISPEDGSEIKPITNLMGEMLGCARKYKVKNEEGKEVDRLDLYTDEANYYYVKGESDWILERSDIHNMGKGNFVYGDLSRHEWAGQIWKMNRREAIDSDSADENKMSAFPILGVKGKIEVKGGAGSNTLKTVELEADGDAKYIETKGSEGRLQTERENLTNDIFRETATPQINFNEINGNLPGVSIEMLMLPAVNKAKRKHRGDIGMFHQRNFNFLKAGMVKICPGVGASLGLVIKPKFKVELPRNRKEEREMVVSAYKAGLMSLAVAVRELGYVTDVDAEVADILAGIKSDVEGEPTPPTPQPDPKV